MRPEVEAALIAVSGTVVVATVGFLTTLRVTKTTILAGHANTDKTLAEQRIRALNERFATANDKLGSDKPAIRLAGVHAIAGLADDWEENRQTCVDVLCAYLRIPYKPDPGEKASAEERLEFRASQEVRHTVIRIIAAHLQDAAHPQDGAAKSWQGLRFDFTGVVFDGGDFSGAVFSGGQVSFGGAEFSAGQVSLTRAVFSAGYVNFRGVMFSGGQVDFGGVTFSGGEVDFSGARFTSGNVYFNKARFTGGRANFTGAEFERVEDRGTRWARCLGERQPGRLALCGTRYGAARSAREHEAVDDQRVLVRRRQLCERHLAAPSAASSKT